jgi:hypothetical protein
LAGLDPVAAKKCREAEENRRLLVDGTPDNVVRIAGAGR